MSGQSSLSHNVFVCDLTLPQCQHTRSDDVSTTISNHGNNITFSLTVRQVSSAHRGAKLHLYQTNKATPLFTCHMHVFSRPRHATCHAELVAPRLIDVTYSASRVFPRVTCGMFQYEMTTYETKRINTDDIDLRHESDVTSAGKETSAEYFHVTCKASIEVAESGVYLFTPIITPVGELGHPFAPNNSQPINVTGKVRSLTLTTSQIDTVSGSDTATVSDTGSDTVTVTICSGNYKIVEFECKAFGFEALESTIFSWTKGLDNTTVSPDRFNQTEHRTTFRGQVFTQHVSHLKVKVEKESKGQPVVCKAQDSYIKLEKKVLLQPRWPPPSGGFFENDHGAEFRLTERRYPAGERVSLRCVVLGGNPLVHSTEVMCNRSLPSHIGNESISPLRFTSDDNIVSFNLTGSEDEIIHCACQYSHISRCSRPPATVVKLTFVQVTDLTSTSTAALSEENPNLLIILISAVCCMCVVGVCVLVFKCLTKVDSHDYDVPAVYVDKFEQLPTGSHIFEPRSANVHEKRRVMSRCFRWQGPKTLY